MKLTPFIDVYEPIHEEFIDDVKQRHPQLGLYNIRSIFRKFNLHLLDIVCEYRQGISLPENLGYLFIGVFPSKDTDFHKYRDFAREHGLSGVSLEHDSIHNQDGFECRLFHSTAKSKCRFSEIKYWGIAPGSSTRATITAAFKSDWKRYIVIPDLRRIKGLYENHRKHATAAYMKKEVLKQYDEFKFD